MPSTRNVARRMSAAFLLPIFYVLSYGCLFSSTILAEWWTFSANGITMRENTGARVEYNIVVYKGLFCTCASGYWKELEESGESVTYPMKCEPLDLSFSLDSKAAEAKNFVVARVCNVLALVTTSLPVFFIPCVRSGALDRTRIGMAPPLVLGGLLLIAFLLNTASVAEFGLFVGSIFGGSDLEAYDSPKLRQIVSQIRSDGVNVDLQALVQVVHSNSPYVVYFVACMASACLFGAMVTTLVIIRHARKSLGESNVVQS